MLEKLEEEELQLANSIKSASDSYKKLSNHDKKALDRKLEGLKKSLQGVKNSIGKEQEKAKAVVEKRNLIEDACENTKSWQTDFKESLKMDTVPLDPEVVKEMIRDLKEKTKGLVMFENSQKQKVDQLMRFLDQWKEPHESDTALVEDTFQQFADCKELVNNQLLMYEKMLEQRENLCGTLDNLEKWTRGADDFLQGVDLKEFCVLDPKLAQIKVKINNLNFKKWRNFTVCLNLLEFSIFDAETFFNSVDFFVFISVSFFGNASFLFMFRFSNAFFCLETSIGTCISKQVTGLCKRRS